MIRNGQVEIGKTPSEASGKESVLIKKGVALAQDEDYKDPFNEAVTLIKENLETQDKDKESEKNA